MLFEVLVSIVQRPVSICPRRHFMQIAGIQLISDNNVTCDCNKVIVTRPVRMAVRNFENDSFPTINAMSYIQNASQRRHKITAFQFVMA